MLLHGGPIISVSEFYNSRPYLPSGCHSFFHVLLAMHTLPPRDASTSAMVKKIPFCRVCLMKNESRGLEPHLMGLFSINRKGLVTKVTKVLDKWIYPIGSVSNCNRCGLPILGSFNTSRKICACKLHGAVASSLDRVSTWIFSSFGACWILKLQKVEFRSFGRYFFIFFSFASNSGHG